MAKQGHPFLYKKKLMIPKSPFLGCLGPLHGAVHAGQHLPLWRVHEPVAEHLAHEGGEAQQLGSEAQ